MMTLLRLAVPPQRAHARLIGCLIGFALITSAAIGAQSDRPVDGALDLAQEVALIGEARAAARADDTAKVDARLRVGRNAKGQEAPSVTLARRTAGVCGWLRNDGEYGRAMQLAQRTIRALDTLEEDTDAERVERLYWEAFLEGEILDHRRRALDLLLAAEKLAPDDDRILEAAQRWSAALAEFGDNIAAEVAR